MPVVLGFVALLALIPLIEAAFAGGARQVLVAAVIGGVLGLLVNLVVQYVGKVIEQFQTEDRRYRSEVALIMPLLMELQDAAVLFRANVTDAAFRRASTDVWDIVKLRLGEFWHPAKVFEVGAAYSNLRVTNELIQASEPHGSYDKDVKAALLKCASDLETAIKIVGAEPIRWASASTEIRVSQIPRPPPSGTDDGPGEA